jgi:hypothetical protein
LVQRSPQCFLFHTRRQCCSSVIFVTCPTESDLTAPLSFSSILRTGTDTMPVQHDERRSDWKSGGSHTSCVQSYMCIPGSQKDPPPARQRPEFSALQEQLNICGNAGADAKVLPAHAGTTVLEARLRRTQASTNRAAYPERTG